MSSDARLPKLGRFLPSRLVPAANAPTKEAKKNKSEPTTENENHFFLRGERGRGERGGERGRGESFFIFFLLPSDCAASARKRPVGDVPQLFVAVVPRHSSSSMGSLQRSEPFVFF